MPRATVGNSLTIDIAEFARRGWWHPNKVIAYGSRWHVGGKQIGAVDWTTSPYEIDLTYSTVDKHGVRTSHAYSVEILRQTDRLGRSRVWLRCPNCDARVRAIHLPRYEGIDVRFLCRRCHGLAYDSQHEHKPAMWAAFDRIMARNKPRPLVRDVEQVMRRDERRDHAVEVALSYFARLEKRAIVHPPNPPGRPSKQTLRARTSALRATERAAAEAKPRRPRGRPKTKRAYARRPALELTPSSSDRAAFCVHCRDRRLLKWARTVTLSNGRPALRGRCATCGTRLCRLLPARTAAA